MRGPLIVLLSLLLLGCVNPTRPDDVPALDVRLQGEQQAAFLKDYAALLLSRGDYDEAGRILETLRRSHPDDLEVTRQLAEVYEKNDQLELALLAWERVHGRSGDRRDAAEYARVALLNEQFEPAEAVFQGWLDEASPGSPDALMALNNLGYSRLLQGDYAQAEAYFEQVLAADPLHTRARANLEWLRRLTFKHESD